MILLTLSAQVRKHRVFAHSVRHPLTKNDGGMFVTVYPGGSFMGLSFEELVQLGSGSHKIGEYKETDFQNTGKEPEHKSDGDKKLAWFEAILFGYQQGAYTSLEVLHASERVLQAFADDK